MGRFDQAISIMSEEAKEASLMRPNHRLISAMAQYQIGQKDKARKTLAAAVLSYDWSVAKANSRDPWIAHILRREAESLILPNLPAFLNGTYQPQDNDERLALLGMCEFKELRAAEAGLLAAAFAVDPKLAEDLNAGLCYRAACAAAVAGCGDGADGAALSEPQRARWRQQARAWLRADLAAWVKRLGSDKPTDRGEVQKAMARWLEDPDLAGLRDPHALNRLSPAERQEWRALWQKVAEVDKSFQNRTSGQPSLAPLREQIVGKWRHVVDGEPQEITLLPSGKINDERSTKTWTLQGRILTLTWPNDDAPGRAWVDTCRVSEDGNSYAGKNQQGSDIHGTKLD
jgi:hypothetical protein